MSKPLPVFVLEGMAKLADWPLTMSNTANCGHHDNGVAISSIFFITSRLTNSLTSVNIFFQSLTKRIQSIVS